MSSKISGVMFGKKHFSGILLSLLNFSLKSVDSDLLSHKRKAVVRKFLKYHHLLGANSFLSAVSLARPGDRKYEK